MIGSCLQSLIPSLQISLFSSLQYFLSLAQSKQMEACAEDCMYCSRPTPAVMPGHRQGLQILMSCRRSRDLKLVPHKY